MAVIITNENQIKAAFKPALKQVVDYILDQILEANTKFIKEKVYDKGTPSVYQRTGEFAEAWDKRVWTAVGTGADVRGEFYYDWEKMSIGSDNPESSNYGQHIGVSGRYKGVDSRQYLANIIYQGIAGPAFGDGYWREKRDAFDRLISNVGKTNFDKWFQQGCKKYGLKVSLISKPEPEKRQ